MVTVARMATCPKCRVQYSVETAVCPTDGEALLPDEAFSNADQDLSPGEQVGEYVVDEKIGHGGFGAVYRATHPLIGKQAAIKVLFRQYSSNPQMVSRFIAEARAVNQIRHKNIIDIFAFGQLPDGRHYYIMELVTGQPLDQVLEQRGGLPLPDAVPILRQLARALDAAHAKGIAHRDLKPENVTLAVDDEGGVFPKLLDFGIAKLLSDGPQLHKTRTGAPMGTPYYMSPEQCRGREIDHRTDIYSFGILCFETLTGKVPFDGDDFMEILLKQINDPPPRASSLVPTIPPGVDEAIAWMLEKDVTRRPPTLAAAIKRLEEGALAGGVAVPVAPPATGFFTPVVRPSTGPMATAPTVAGTPAMAQSFIAAESAVPEKTAKRNRMTVLFAATMLLMFGVVATTLVLLRGRRDEASVPPVVAEPKPAATSAPPPPAAEPMPSLPQVIVIPSPTPATEVTLQIKTTPPGAEVRLDGERLGVTPGAFSLARSEQPQKLTVVREGYREHVQDLVLRDNLQMTLELEKKKTTPSKRPGKKPRKPGQKGDIPDWDDLE
jgi:eukaryotic-like serine/threonine-protein kinase